FGRLVPIWRIINIEDTVNIISLKPRKLLRRLYLDHLLRAQKWRLGAVDFSSMIDHHHPQIDRAHLESMDISKNHQIMQIACLPHVGITERSCKKKKNRSSSAHHYMPNKPLHKLLNYITNMFSFYHLKILKTHTF
ncbi:hypothetical protein ACJX0J_007023, partial [Zea mays]